MIYDLFLNNSAGVLLGIAKLDISSNTENIGQKQVSISDISFNPPSGEDEKEVATIVAQQQKIERFIQPRDFLMQDLLDQLTNIEVIAKFKRQ